MLLTQVRCFIILFFLKCVDSGRVLRNIKEHVQNLQLQRAKQDILMLTLTSWQTAEHMTQGKILQPLDHFDRRNNKTFHQHFLVNDAYWQRAHGPVFLYIGGEGPLSEIHMLAGHHVDMAQHHGALLVALEHRFYGNSINPDGLQTKNLVNLNSQQALADLATFHFYITNRFTLSHENTWISFGGSYSGALSAWFRGKFPHLVYGAVASSAPVKAELDFSSYNKIVGLSLLDEAVGGSDKCVAKVREAFAAVEAALTAGNISQVAKDFGSCHIPKDLDDQIMLMQNLADIFMGTVQYNEEGVMGIDDLCGIMTNKSQVNEEELKAYDCLVKLAQAYRSLYGEQCLDASQEQLVKELMDTTPRSSSFGARQWLYQTCTEFGFYQTCEDASCPFSKFLTLQTHTKLCLLLFDISQDSLPARIAFTNKYYGADHPHTHRVLYINGGIDPWHALSVCDGTEERDKDQVVFIKDTAHCADMMNSRASDRSTLKKAREEIERHVAEWLKSAARENIQK